MQYFFEGVCRISHVSPFTGVRRGQSGHWQIANSAFPNFSRFYWEGASLGFHIILPLLPHSTFKYSTQIHLSTRCEPRIPHHSLAATFYICRSTTLLGFDIGPPLLPHSTFKHSTKIRLCTWCQPRIPHQSTPAKKYVLTHCHCCDTAPHLQHLLTKLKSTAALFSNSNSITIEQQQ